MSYDSSVIVPGKPIKLAELRSLLKEDNLAILLIDESRDGVPVGDQEPLRDAAVVGCGLDEELGPRITEAKTAKEAADVLGDAEDDDLEEGCDLYVVDETSIDPEQKEWLADDVEAVDLNQPFTYYTIQCNSSGVDLSTCLVEALQQLPGAEYIEC